MNIWKKNKWIVYNVLITDVKSSKTVGITLIIILHFIRVTMLPCIKWTLSFWRRTQYRQLYGMLWSVVSWLAQWWRLPYTEIPYYSDSTWNDSGFPAHSLNRLLRSRMHTKTQQTQCRESTNEAKNEIDDLNLMRNCDFRIKY
jgi:hypothetical protein